MTQEKLIRSKTNPGAVLNTDNTALDAYKKRREKDRRMDLMERDFQELKQDFRELKSILHMIAEKIGK